MDLSDGGDDESSSDLDVMSLPSFIGGGWSEVPREERERRDAAPVVATLTLPELLAAAALECEYDDAGALPTTSADDNDDADDDTGSHRAASTARPVIQPKRLTSSAAGTRAT